MANKDDTETAPEATQDTLRLTLFVSGNGERAQTARANLHAVLDRLDSNRPEVVEVDSFVDPRTALAHGVFATPALMRPDDQGRPQILYGDLSEHTRVFNFIGRMKSAT